MKYLLTDQETERLTFRLLTQDDFDTWTALFRAENVGKFLKLDPNFSDIEMCQAWFNKQLNRYEKELGGMNVMVDKATNQLIGQCGILVQDIEGDERLEVGYSILPKFWKMGYATEVALKCRDYAFEQNFADALISVIHVDNIGSEKVALRNGMTFEKRMDDFNIFRIDRKDWEGL